jgi:hypothetical protein
MTDNVAKGLIFWMFSIKHIGVIGMRERKMITDLLAINEDAPNHWAKVG